MTSTLLCVLRSAHLRSESLDVFFAATLKTLSAERGMLCSRIESSNYYVPPLPNRPTSNVLQKCNRGVRGPGRPHCWSRHGAARNGTAAQLAAPTAQHLARPRHLKMANLFSFFARIGRTFRGKGPKKPARNRLETGSSRLSRRFDPAFFTNMSTTFLECNTYGRRLNEIIETRNSVRFATTTKMRLYNMRLLAYMQFHKNIVHNFRVVIRK